MITFPCQCGMHKFDVHDQEAGSSVQCPVCKRLNDVPTLAELQALDADGSLKFAEEKPGKDKNRLAELHRTWGRSRRDESGNEIDLRQTFDDLRSVGEKPIDIAAEKSAADNTPRYDPMTGELLRPLEIKAPAPRPVIAIDPASAGVGGAGGAGAWPGQSRRGQDYGMEMDQRRTRGRMLGYSRRSGGAAVETDIPGLGSLPLRLLEPINLLVMFFVVIMLLVFESMTLPLIGGFFVVAPVPFLMSSLIIAHYGNCIQDLGPGGEEELPTPLRYAGFSDDIWWPFVHLFFSLMVCFAPACMFSVLTRGPVQLVGGGVLFFAGTCMFPAIALTLCASAQAGNLRPDRVLSLIVTLGPQYVPSILICLAAVVLNVLAVSGGAISLVMSATSSNLRGFLTVGGGSLVLALLGVYTGHLAAWWLGVLYRRHEGALPWQYEEMDRGRVEAKRLKTMAEIERAKMRKYAGV